MSWNDWREKHKQFKAALDADQVEREAIRIGPTSIEFGTEDERTAGVIDDALAGQGNAWDERQEVLENVTGAVAEEIERRVQIMGNAYPFALLDGALEYTPSGTGVYEYCLEVAARPSAEIPRFPKASAVFEYIARDVITIHIGGGKGFRTGAPIYPAEARGNSTRESFLELNAQCGEFVWEPRPDFPSEPSHQDLKDAGLDVVVWKPWPDGRNAHLFFIGQCACGKNDININKARETSLGRLSNWLRPIAHVTPMRSFLTAHHIPNTIQLYEISGEGGLVFDRARIVMIAESDLNFMTRDGAHDYMALAKLLEMQPVA